MPAKKSIAKNTTKTKSTGQAVKKLYRSSTNKVLGGVCAGLGNFFAIDPVLIRIIFIFFLVFGGGGLLVYIILWLIIPSEISGGEITDKNIKQNVGEIQDKVQDFAENIKGYSTKHSGKKIAGFILITLGILLLLSNLQLLQFGFFFRFWPILLIIVAIGLLTKD